MNFCDQHYLGEAFQSLSASTFIILINTCKQKQKVVLTVIYIIIKLLEYITKVIPETK